MFAQNLRKIEISSQWRENLLFFYTNMAAMTQTEQEEKISKDCAEELKKWFDGNACMGTSIHAMTPWFDDYQKFFFDEKYMVKSCAGAT